MELGLRLNSDKVKMPYSTSSFRLGSSLFKIKLNLNLKLNIALDWSKADINI